jgi:hypothetical protein
MSISSSKGATTGFTGERTLRIRCCFSKDIADQIRPGNEAPLATEATREKKLDKRLALA